jgi:predicted transcriptional regulator
MNFPDFDMIEVNQLLILNAQKHNLRAGDIFPWAIIKELLSIKKLNLKQKAALLRDDGSTPALERLVDKGYFEKRNLDYMLTKSGEDFLYYSSIKFPELTY